MTLRTALFQVQYSHSRPWLRLQVIDHASRSTKEDEIRAQLSWIMLPAGYIYMKRDAKSDSIVHSELTIKSPGEQPTC